MSERDQILSLVKNVPMLPVAAVKAIGILQDPRAQVSEIARIISHDPGLTANALRMANSAMFGGQKKIHTIEAAVVRMGVRRMLDLVVCSVVKPHQTMAIRGYDLPAGTLWLHSVAVACGTEELAKVLKLSVPSGAFTAGLLIDVGKSVLASHLEPNQIEAIRQQAFDQQISFDQAERHVLGTDHAEVGSILLEYWGLPQSLVAVTRWHHEPQQCPTEHQTLIDIVHASDQICTFSGIGGGSDGSHYRPSEEVMVRLGIDVHVIEAALCRIVERLETLADILGAVKGSV